MEKDDFGLNLSLGFTQKQHSLQLNLNSNPSKSLSSSSPSSVLCLQKLPWNQALPSSDLNPQFMGGTDVNRAPLTVECEEDGDIMSSPNSTVSSLSGKRNEREGNLVDDTEIAERGFCRGSSDEDEDGGENSRKKLRLSKDQSAVLEDTFKNHSTLNPKQKVALAKQLGLRPRQVEVWFQNRRARTKLKQTEVDREYLQHCYEALTEENRRLKKEVTELRALKLSPNLHNAAHMTPPTTLTMCPSCERVAVSPPFVSAVTHQRRSNSWVPGPSPPSDVLRL